MHDEQTYQVEVLDRHVRENPDANIILLLRHSTREDISRPDVERALSAPLTRPGRDRAWDLGRHMPNSRPVRLRFSRIPRCVDTAHFIRRGIIEKGGDCEIVGARDYLEAPYVRDAMAVMRAFLTHGQRGFAREWADGRLGQDVIQDITTTGRELLDRLVGSLSRDEPGTTSVCITHDVSITAILSLVLDVGQDDFAWPDYLGGPVMVFEDDTVVFHYREQALRLLLKSRTSA